MVAASARPIARSINRGAAVALSVADDNGGLVLADVRLNYDYSQIDPAVRDAVVSAAVAVKRQESQVRESILIVGRRLIEVKDLLDHGEFEHWCDVEFGMSARTARNMMNAARVFGDKSETVSVLSDSALYLLSAPSTPDEVRAEVIEVARASGVSPTKAAIQTRIAASRPQPAGRVHYVRDDVDPIPADDLPVREYDPDLADQPAVVPSEATHTRQTLPALGKCAVCGRPLSDPAHAAAGCGPVCSAKRAALGAADGADPVSVAPADADALAAWAGRVHLATAARLAALRDLYVVAADAAGEYAQLTGDQAGAAAVRAALSGPAGLLAALCDAAA